MTTKAALLSSLAGLGALAGLAGLLFLRGAPPASPPPEPRPRGGVAHPPITVIRLVRPGCMGRCPQYAVELRTDSLATYSGGSSGYRGGPGPAHGRYAGRVAPADFTRLAQLFEAQGFFKLTSNCPEESAAVDGAVCHYLSVQRDGRWTSLSIHSGGSDLPVDLLTEATDALAKRVPWQRVPAPITQIEFSVRGRGMLFNRTGAAQRSEYKTAKDYEGHIDSATFGQLARSLEQAHYYDLRSSYPSNGGQVPLLQVDVICNNAEDYPLILRLSPAGRPAQQLHAAFAAAAARVVWHKAP